MSKRKLDHLLASDDEVLREFDDDDDYDDNGDIMQILTFTMMKILLLNQGIHQKL